MFQCSAGLCPAGQPRAAVPTWSGTGSQISRLLPAQGCTILLECIDELLEMILLAWFCGSLTAQIAPSAIPGRQSHS